MSLSRRLPLWAALLTAVAVLTLPTVAQDAGAAPAPSGPVSVVGDDAASAENQPLGDPNQQPVGQPTGGLGPWIWMLPLGMIVLMIFTSGRQQKKERQQRQELLGSLRKNDKVQTSGGIIGTIVELHDDDLVLRVDESSNTRIRFARNAVTQLLSERGPRDLPIEPTAEPKTAETVNA